MLPPQAGAAPAVARPLARIRGARCCGSRPAGKPPRWPMPCVVGHGCGRFPWCRGLGLRGLLGQVTRRHPHEAPCLRGDAPIAVCDLHLSEPTVAMPAPWRLGLRPPGCLEQEGEGRWLPPPGFAGLTDGTGARDERDEVNRRLETHA